MNYPDIGLSLTCYVEYADLAKYRSRAQSNKHFGAIFGDHVEPSSFYDVELFADVTLATDIVARTEDGEFQFENEFSEQPGLAFLEYRYSLHRFHVHADRNLRLEVSQNVIFAFTDESIDAKQSKV